MSESQLVTPLLQQVSEQAWLVTLFERITPNAPPVIASLTKHFEKQLKHCLHSATPSYTTLLIETQPQVTQRLIEQTLQDWQNSTQQHSEHNANIGETHHIPVYYSAQSGEDLEWIATQAGLTVEQVIELHSAPLYPIYAVGFSPGFAFAAGVAESLRFARRKTPRQSVPVGSIAIAAEQTAIYPFATPGGWHLLGKTPLHLVDYNKRPISRFRVGDVIKFEPIDKQRFIELGGEL